MWLVMELDPFHVLKVSNKEGLVCCMGLWIRLPQDVGFAEDGKE